MNKNGKRSDDKLSFLKNKKNALLNKFLTKTFHMIEQCNPMVACWSTDGKSFLIKDVDYFSKNILPLYFKHSKFASFVRQLNFYSFRKLRAESDDRSSVTEWMPRSSGSNSNSKSGAVRFAHEFFRRGQPELLHRITRVTKSQEPTSSEMKSLKEDILELRKDIVALSNRFDHRLQAMEASMEADYQQRTSDLAASYQALYAFYADRGACLVGASEQAGATQDAPLSAAAGPDREEVAAPASSTPSDGARTAKTPAATISESSGSIASITSSNETGMESSSPERHKLSPLMTLSGVATALMKHS